MRTLAPLLSGEPVSGSPYLVGRARTRFPHPNSVSWGAVLLTTRDSPVRAQPSSSPRRRAPDRAAGGVRRGAAW